MKASLALLAATLVAAPALVSAQSAQQDPLGLGQMGRDRPKGSSTEITAQKEATFDEKENRAVFTGDVRVKDVSFLLSSDRLTVILAKNRSGIERAIAEGNVVIVQQTKNPEEKGAVGRSRQAEYIPATGTITLSGSPEITQGINRHIATSPETRMILNRDGKATTDGPSRTVITDTQKLESLK